MLLFYTCIYILSVRIEMRCTVIVLCIATFIQNANLCMKLETVYDQSSLLVLLKYWRCQVVMLEVVIKKI